MEKLLDICKILLEKYFIPTIISIPIAIYIVAKFPDILSIKSQTTSSLYFLLVLCTVFLVILATKTLITVVKNRWLACKQKCYNKQQADKELQTQIEMILLYVDGLSPVDKETLYRFLKTNNCSIESSEIYDSSSIYNNKNIMNSTVKRIEERPFSRCVADDNFSKEHICMPIDIPPQKIVVKEYKLKDEFFELLKLAYEKHKRISNFKEENQ